MRDITDSFFLVMKSISNLVQLFSSCSRWYWSNSNVAILLGFAYCENRAGYTFNVEKFEWSDSESWEWWPIRRKSCASSSSSCSGIYEWLIINASCLIFISSFDLQLTGCSFFMPDWLEKTYQKSSTSNYAKDTGCNKTPSFSGNSSFYGPGGSWRFYEWENTSTSIATL